jgi:hypothetical protein
MKLAGAGVTQDPTIFTGLQARRQPAYPSETEDARKTEVADELHKQDVVQRNREAARFAKAAYDYGCHLALSRLG